jgi:hypothetical protein
LRPAAVAAAQPQWSFLREIRSGFVTLLFGLVYLGLLPLLIGLVVDLALIAPVRPPWHAAPHVSWYQDWAFGLFITRTVLGALANPYVIDARSAFAVNLRRFFDHPRAWAGPHAGAIVRHCLVPLAAWIATFLLVAPLVAARIGVPLLLAPWVPWHVAVAAARLAHTFALFAYAVYAIAVLARVVYRHAQAALIEERFVIERRLQNQADDAQAQQ